MPQIVSTPNDYAVEVQNLRGCVTTFMVCKYQPAPWAVVRADHWPELGESHWTQPENLAADTFSQAVANANAAADSLAAIVGTSS